MVMEVDDELFQLRDKIGELEHENQLLTDRRNALLALLKEVIEMAAERDVMGEPAGWKRADAYDARIAEMRRLAVP